MLAIALWATLSLGVAGPALAQTGAATGIPQTILTYGNGMVLVTGLYFSAGTCSNNSGFVIYADHPYFARILSTVLTAKALGATLSVSAKIDSCWYPEITQDPSTYVSINP